MAVVTIHKDGSVDVTLATQDIGGGARTVALVVASKRLGYLPFEKIRVQIGDSRLPPSGTSGGSATTGAVTNQVTQAVNQVVGQLFNLVAPSLGVSPQQLSLDLGRVVVQGQPDKSLSWDEACAKIGDVLMAYAPSGVDWEKPIYDTEMEEAAKAGRVSQEEAVTA